LKEYRIDINCDVGEGVGNEDQLFPFISSCNIACGGHAGDPETIESIIRLAKLHQVKIGAHPSYPDRENFGRKSMNIKADALIDNLQEQLKLFLGILKAEDGELNHIKAHGALYNDLAKNSELAEVFLHAITPYLGSAKIYVPYGSAIAEMALIKEVLIAYEAFADRSYNADLSLVSRKLPGALITEPKAALEHLERMVKNGKVKSQNGELVDIEAETYCIHGDTPSALQILAYLVEELPRQKIVIEK